MSTLSSVANSSGADVLPTSAFRAPHYADWQDAKWCTWPRPLAVQAPLPDAVRRWRVARASSSISGAPRYSIVDTHNGAYTYWQPRSAAEPMFEAWQSQVLEAIRHLRRWHYYAADAPLPALPAQPLDGCSCRVCWSR